MFVTIANIPFLPHTLSLSLCYTIFYIYAISFPILRFVPPPFIPLRLPLFPFTSIYYLSHHLYSHSPLFPFTPFSFFHPPLLSFNLFFCSFHPLLSFFHPLFCFFHLLFCFFHLLFRLSQGPWGRPPWSSHRHCGPITGNKHYKPL